jgi:hypothetical protein
LPSKKEKKKKRKRKEKEKKVISQRERTPRTVREIIRDKGRLSIYTKNDQGQR